MKISTKQLQTARSVHTPQRRQKKAYGGLTFCCSWGLACEGSFLPHV